MKKRQLQCESHTKLKNLLKPNLSKRPVVVCSQTEAYANWLCVQPLFWLVLFLDDSKTFVARTGKKYLLIPTVLNIESWPATDVYGLHVENFSATVKLGKTSQTTTTLDQL